MGALILPLSQFLQILRAFSLTDICPFPSKIWTQSSVHSDSLESLTGTMHCAGLTILMKIEGYNIHRTVFPQLAVSHSGKTVCPAPRFLFISYFSRKKSASLFFPNDSRLYQVYWGEARLTDCVHFQIYTKASLFSVVQTASTSITWNLVEVQILSYSPELLNQNRRVNNIPRGL